MSQCTQTAEEFIQSTFSPHIAVLGSREAELSCQKNNLTFQQLIQPFCRLSSEVHIRDANNVSHSIHGLRIRACDMGSQGPQQAAVKKALSDAVANNIHHLPNLADGRTNVRTFGNYDLCLNGTTAWFEAWRDQFIQTMPLSDHEYLSHCLACLFVVSSAQPDPLSAFTALANQQLTQQQHFPNKTPRWFCQGVLHYYVLLHDVVDGEQARAEAIYQSMKSTFGAQICHLLQINSRSNQGLDSLRPGPSLPDPWSQFLPKPQEFQDGPEEEVVGAQDDSAFPCELVEGTGEVNSVMLTSVDSASELFEGDANSPSDLDKGFDQASHVHAVFDHPLSMLPPSSKTVSGHVMLSPDTDPTAAANGYVDSGLQQSYSQTSSSDLTKSRVHGGCLTTSDQDRLRIFMHEFVVRALIPWAERQMKLLNEQLTSRKGIHRSLFSATKKWFGGSKPSGPIPASQNTTVVYTKEAPELQLRRLGDLAFLFQMYEFAFNMYHAAKKDFNNDHAWLHFAGALEMASLSVFMQGARCQRPYPHHYMETSISTYLTSCRNPAYAMRSTLLSTEILKLRGMFSEAAMQFLRMITEEADLSSALFLEQAAHCFIAMATPMVRKYAFHMILAGHRFNKAGQRKHALRCYSQALQVYKSKHWSTAEDHIHFTIGRQSFNLKQLDNATSAFKHLLTGESKQSAAQQGAFLREYLFVYKQLLSQEAGESSSYGRLPELPLPKLKSNATKVLLDQHSLDQQGADTNSSGRRTAATGITFADDLQLSRWSQLEEATATMGGPAFSVFRPTIQLFTDLTDNKYNPIAFVGEAIQVEVVLENELQVVLVLSDITLLWTFLPAITGSAASQLIYNEVTSLVKNNLADEIIQTSVVAEAVLLGGQTKTIVLGLVPRQAGELRVVGLAYSLSTSSLTQNAPMVGDGSASKPSYAASICVRGKQRLEVQGPRLNISKEEKSNKVYGPDRRLDILVQEEMPILNVVFCEFPEVLLCGEVHCVQVEFTNAGKLSLHKLRLASSHPHFYTFGCGPKEELPKYPYTYALHMSAASHSQPKVYMAEGSVESVILRHAVCVPLPGEGILHPGETITLAMWLRGNDIGGVQEVDFLFYYEPLATHSRHRLLRHKAVIRTVESLSVRALAVRESSSVLRSAGRELQSCFVFCELENLSQVQVQRPHIQELQVAQVVGVSPTWTVDTLSTATLKGLRIGSRETLQLVLKGAKTGSRLAKTGSRETLQLVFKGAKTGSDNHLQYSEVPFDTQQIQSTKSPCRDFYMRSRSTLRTGESNNKDIKGKFQDLEAALKVNLTLIFLWKAFVVQENGQMKILVGQHHVHIHTINTYVTSYPLVLAPTHTPVLKFTQDSEEDVPSVPGAEVSTRLVSFSFRHQPSVSHDFKKGLCVVPVTLTLQNHASCSVKILVDTSKSSDRFSSSDKAYAAAAQIPGSSTSALNRLGTPALNSMRWVGHTNARTSLEQGQSTQLELRASFLRAGTYNLNTVAVYVTYMEDQSQMILQRQSNPAIITLLSVT